ncbi:hypothetical protein COHA_008489 [Chlorella ohadii]|uniref:FAD-binding FR-type domain-containing protein n=1 Tax=Chlorella ohadii TaxID=2649997 RepID=A0AAD5GYS5_9CHLO|nr:hypothetical protein COHA_008489 [Chlorella ohadii]
MLVAATPTFKQSEGVKSLKTSSLSGPTIVMILLTWVSLLVATLLVLIVRRMPGARAPPPPARDHGWVAKARRVLAWQVPPRRFFAYWCDGLSAGEALGVLLWFGLNAWWLGQLCSRSFANATSATKRLEKTAVAFGKMMAPNLMLLFLPVPHCSFITWGTGISRNALIRYHRWLGHGTIWVLNLHAILYYIAWGIQHEFWTELVAWGGKVNNLAGTIGWIFVLVLWITSLEKVRRRLYQLFFRCHIVCFLGFFLFSCCHYAQSYTYFVPGLLLYAADIVLRAGQLCNVTPVVAATVDEVAGTATLQLQADKCLDLKPLTEVWLSVPKISRWSMHPFSVADCSGSRLTLHVKRYGAFTKSLLEGLRDRSITAVRVVGPHGACDATLGCQLSPADSWLRYKSLLLIGGGVGVNALLSMLRSIAAQRAAGQHPGLPRRVRCVWAARSVREFHTLDAPLLLAATDPAGWLDLSLHVTGSSAPAIELSSNAGEAPAHLPKKGSSASFKGSDLASCDSSVKDPSEAETEDAQLLAPHAQRTASPFFWSMLRPVQPQTFGVAHIAAVNVLVVLGAFCAALLAASYNSQVVQWKGGMLFAVLLPAVGLGLPYAIAVFPVHALRYWRAARAVKQGADGCKAEMVTPYADNSALISNACSVDKCSVSLGDASLEVQQGRPDVEGLLRKAAAEAGPGNVVGVYAGGPPPLMTAVHLAVARLNGGACSGGAEGAYLELHKEAVEL